MINVHKKQKNTKTERTKKVSFGLAAKRARLFSTLKAAVMPLFVDTKIIVFKNSISKTIWEKAPDFRLTIYIREDGRRMVVHDKVSLKKEKYDFCHEITKAELFDIIKEFNKKIKGSADAIK